MKIGDLVELSAYGKARHMNSRWRGDIGVIVPRFGPCRNSTYFNVKWLRADDGHRLMYRKELKYAR